MKRLAAIITAVAVTLAACSGDESATTTTAPSTVTATSAATTTSSTTTSTSSTTTTTTAPTTTTVPLDVEIQAALDFYADAFFTCGERPADCDQSFVAPNSSIAQGVAAFVQRFIDNDRYFSPDRRGTYVKLTSIDSQNSDTVEVSSCWYDAAIILGAPGPDGQPTVFNDRVASQLFELTFVRVGGVWLAADLQSGEILGEDVDLCGG
jgi:hypothetical protein